MATVHGVAIVPSGVCVAHKKEVDFEKASLVWKELKSDFVQLTNSDSTKKVRTEFKHDGSSGGSLLKICSNLKLLSGETLRQMEAS